MTGRHRARLAVPAREATASSGSVPAPFFSTEPEDLIRVLAQLRAARHLDGDVYEDLEAVLGEYTYLSADRLREFADRLLTALNYLLVRAQTPELTGRCPVEAVQRAATRARLADVHGPATEVDVGGLRLLALAVLDLLDLIGGEP
jgi:hypothetical protein